MNFEGIIAELQAYGNSTSIDGMSRFGINPDKVWGVKIPVLRKMAKKIKKNHKLGQQLWDFGYRETMILATMVSNPEEVTENQMETWVLSPYFTYWEIVDQTCMNLFSLTKYAYKKAFEWSNREEEYVKRAAFALMAVLAWKDKNASDEKFLSFFPLIRSESTDERNDVKKAVNWALRQIGKRNQFLNTKTLELAKQIQEIDSKSARWIAKDAIKELENDSVQSRLG